MTRLRIYLFLTFLIAGSAVATAGETPRALENASQMNDEALVSYISGRLTAALKDENVPAELYCDNSGCAVLVH